VGIASAIEEEWLEEVHPGLLERKVVHRFDEERGRVLTVRQTFFSGLLVREDPARGDAAGAEEALLEYLLRDPARLFEGDEEAGLLLRRVRFLARHMPELKLPAFDEAEFGEVLRGACGGCRSVEDVRRRGLAQHVASRLSWQQRQALDQHAPERVEVPSGNRIRIEYGSEDAAPVLAVRLQEVFGWSETPRLAAGRVPVLMHLLAPNYRPAQITSDLRSFWNNTYQEVRKELRARYPKHSWPEDPWTAPATARTKRRS
jgi:ATP-dependent helicase HrpB